MRLPSQMVVQLEAVTGRCSRWKVFLENIPSGQGPSSGAGCLPSAQGCVFPQLLQVSSGKLLRM